MKKLLKVLLALVMAVSLAACGGGDNEDKTTFTYAIGGEADYLDPAHGSDSVTAYITNQTNMPLVSINEEGKVVNEAAKEIVRSTNAAGQPVLTITLIDGLKWSNGDALTAEHYVYGMKHSVGLGTADAYYSYFITDYVVNADKYNDGTHKVADMTDMGVKALDEKTIEITLKKNCDYFEQLMAAGVFYPAHPEYAKDNDYTWADDPTVPTSGAFKYESIDRAAEIVMVKNENYVYADKVNMKKLVAKVMTDMDAQAMAFKTGEIDWATSLNTSVATEYEGDDDLLVSTSIINYFMLLNSKDDALKDKNVRRAVALGIDRSAIITALNVPSVYTELKGFVPTGFPDGDGDFRAKGGDLVTTDKEQAKALLKAAGYDENNPLKLEYSYNESAMHSTVAEVLKQQLAEVNIELTLKTAELRTFFDNRDNGLFQIARHAMSADYLDTTTYLDMAASWNQSTISWGDDHYDDLLLEAQKLTGDERIAKLHEAEKYLVEEMTYCVPLFEYKAVTLRDSNITGYSTNAQANFDFRYISK